MSLVEIVLIYDLIVITVSSIVIYYMEFVENPVGVV